MLEEKEINYRFMDTKPEVLIGNFSGGVHECRFTLLRNRRN
jgi:hypothetical protein